MHGVPEYHCKEPRAAKPCSKSGYSDLITISETSTGGGEGKNWLEAGASFMASAPAMVCPCTRDLEANDEEMFEGDGRPALSLFRPNSFGHVQGSELVKVATEG